MNRNALIASVFAFGASNVALGQVGSIGVGDSLRVTEVLRTHTTMKLQLPAAVDPTGDGKIDKDDRAKLVSQRRLVLVKADNKGTPEELRIEYEIVPAPLLVAADGERIVDVSTPLANTSYVINCAAAKVSRTDAKPLSAEEATGLKNECRTFTRLLASRARLSSVAPPAPVTMRDAVLVETLPAGLDCLGIMELRLTAAPAPVAPGVSVLDAQADAEQTFANQVSRQTYTGSIRIDVNGSMRWLLSYKGLLSIPLPGGGPPATGSSSGDIELNQVLVKLK